MRSTFVISKIMRIWGFIPDGHTPSIEVGQEFGVRRPDRRTEVARAIVVSIAPDVQTVLEVLDPFNGRPIRSRLVLLEPQETNNLVPGESIRIYSHRGLLEELKATFL